ncbi:MAG: hypothetical protein VB141_11470 [Burkholderia gladioli]
MKLDRSLQLAILNLCAEAHPATVDPDTMNQLLEEHDKHVVASNLRYLEEHGVIEGGVKVGADNHFAFSCPAITWKGQDFLLGDGGLSAILGVITVQLHGDTIKALLEQKIQESDIPTADKPQWIDALRQLPADATKHLTMKLLDLGLAHAPGALHAIQTALHLS